MEEVVPIVHRLADGRIDFQAMWLTNLLAAGVQHLAGREGVIVLGVNEEDRRRDVVNGGPGPRAPTPGANKTITPSRENNHPPPGPFTFAPNHPERTPT